MTSQEIFDNQSLMKEQLSFAFIRQYQKDAARTNADLKTKGENLMHMVVGMCSELNEVEDALRSGDKVNLGEELADICWYMANFCTINNCQFDDVYHVATHLVKTQNRVVNNIFGHYKTKQKVSSLYNKISKLQDVVKKFRVYEKNFNYGDVFCMLQDILATILEICYLEKVDFFTSLKNNINKLKKRFPDKFNVENANNRNLEAERVELEK